MSTDEPAEQAAEQPTNAEVIEVVVELLQAGKSKAEVWQALVDEGVVSATASGSVALVERAALMFGSGMSEAEVWQALVDKKVEASIATAAVSGLSKGIPLAPLGLALCSRCGAAAPESRMTLSRGGEPRCQECVNVASTAALQRRADAAIGVRGTVRRCRRCGQPAMRCVQVQVVTKGFQSTTNYKFVCGVCTHSFTGNDGFGPYLMLITSLGAILYGVSLFPFHTPRSGGKEFLIALAGLGLGIYAAYNALIWQLYPEVTPRD
jgi:hypothetical protein